jgi:hypothetical protein
MNPFSHLKIRELIVALGSPFFPPFDPPPLNLPTRLSDIDRMKADVTGEAIDQFHNSVVENVSTKFGLLARSDYESYGSGYASFADVFLFRKKALKIQSRKISEVVKGVKKTVDLEDHIYEGVRFLLSREAPVFAFGMDTESTTYQGGKCRGGSSGFLSKERLGSVPAYWWPKNTVAVTRMFQAHGLKILDRATLATDLDFDAEIATNLKLTDNPRFAVFEAAS